MAKRGRPRQGVTFETIKVEIEQNHLSILEIATKYGVSDDTVRRRMKEAGQPNKQSVRKKKGKESPNAEAVQKKLDGRQWLMSHADDSGVTRYHYNKDTDRYITYLKAAPEPLVVPGETHRQICQAYSNWDGRPSTINEVCRQFCMPRPWLVEYMRAHGITHDKEPFSNEELLDRQVEELTQDALQFRRMALHQDYEREKWKEVKADANKWRNFEYNVLRPLKEEIRNHPDHKPVLLKIDKAKRDFGLVLGLMDVHYGKGVWKLSDGTELYKREQVSDYVLGCMGRVFSDLAASYGRPEKIIIPIGSDFLHIDNPRGQTTAGTQQDMSTVPELILIEGCKLAVSAVDAARQVSPEVELVLCAGNHDQFSSLSLLMYLEAKFGDKAGVKVNLSADPRQYTTYGDTLIGFTHGNDVKSDQLSKLMANEARELWGKTKYRAYFTGHMHFEQTREEGGIIHYQVPSLSPADRWHQTKGYVMSRQAISAHVIDRVRGPRATFTELAETDSSYGLKMKNRSR
jgi:predicted phosphodiesterase